MKTTLEIPDALFARAKREAARTGRPLRELVEDGLRLVLDRQPPGRRFVLPDRSVGNPKGENPLEALSWQDLRNEIYGNR